MILPDANLLIYAHDESCPQHPKALGWWQHTLAGRETIGIPWIVLLAFTRLLTSPQICLNPLTTGQVREIVEGWLSGPNIRMIQVSPRAVGGFFDLLQDAGTGGNLCTDALIALHAREHSATIYSNDRDFDRFPGVKWANPLR
jgi:toxin-antitoxin system PIN domain toxin